MEQPLEMEQAKANPTLLWQPGWNAKSCYSDWQMRDWREQLKGGTSTWEKVKIGAFGVIAISLLLITFITWQASTPGHDPTPPAATEEEVPNAE